MLNWIKTHISWVFSGVGVAVAVATFNWFYAQPEKSPTLVSQTQSGSGNIQAGGNVTIVEKRPKARIEISEATIQEFPLAVNHLIAFRNSSEVNAKNIKFEVISFLDDKVSLVFEPPNSKVEQGDAMNVTSNDLTPARFHVLVPYLSPNDHFVLMVQHPREQWEKWKGDFQVNGVSVRTPNIQNLTFDSEN